MIWFIIATTLLVLSIGCTILSSTQYKRWDKKAQKAKTDNSVTCSTFLSIVEHRERWEWSELALYFSIIITVCSVLLVYVPILCAHSWCGKYKKQELLNRYNMLVELKAQEKNITIQNDLFDKIYDYNQEVIMNHHRASSSWTNWYYCDDYSDVPLIEINN